MSGTLSRSTQIATTPEALWNLLTTTAGIPDWYDDWDAVEYDDVTDQRLHVGASFRLLRHDTSAAATALCRVTLVEQPHRLIWLEYVPLHSSVSVEFHLDPDSTRGGTVLTLSKRY